MSTQRSRTSNRFSATTSRFLLPTFRRPCYLEINKLHVPEQSKVSSIFNKWTQDEPVPYYNIINNALLNDDYNILKKNASYIHNLKMAIKKNCQNDTIKVYRNLELDRAQVQSEYREGMRFLWPTFSSTSRNKDVAAVFGNYTFEINAAGHDNTYRADISNYSEYPYEQEVLFYPYSGFRVKTIIPSARLIQLESVDTQEVESYSRTLIPERLKLFDGGRKMFVYLYKNSQDVHWSQSATPNQLYLIAQNRNGYWDSHFRYHHRNGYFINKGNNLWEEHKNNQHHASFQQM